MKVIYFLTQNEMHTGIRYLGMINLWCIRRKGLTKCLSEPNHCVRLYRKLVSKESFTFIWAITWWLLSCTVHQSSSSWQSLAVSDLTDYFHERSRSDFSHVILYWLSERCVYVKLEKNNMKMHARNMPYIRVGNILWKTDNSYNLELAVC